MPEQTNDKIMTEAYQLAGMIGVTELTPEKTQLNFTTIRQRNFSLVLRWVEARRRLSAALRGIAKREWADGTDHLLIETKSQDLSLRLIILRCADALVGPATRPLTPRLLLVALPITNKERLRWTKDGRLPRSGSVKIRKAQPLSVSTYEVDVITRLGPVSV